MAADTETKRLRSDKWLAGLVEAMDDLSAADDICRSASPIAVSHLLEQLHAPPEARARRKSVYQA